jgi:hypothetical protein
MNTNEAYITLDHISYRGVTYILWFTTVPVTVAGTVQPVRRATACYDVRLLNQDTGLGIGLLDLRNHAKALKVKWALRYLDASDGPWKLLLD